MTYDNLLKLLLAGASLCLGAYLAAIRSRISSLKIRNSLHYSFYVVSFLIFTSSLVTIFLQWNKLIEPDWFGIIVLVAALTSSILLFLFTKRSIVGKHQYKTKELDPIVNAFTENADKKNIKLLAGDINFFGNYPKDMEENSQYKCLKKESFREIQILCIEPTTNEGKTRYGKIISDLPGVELKYYNPPQADLLIRGRLKTLNNVTHLLIYKKIESGIYEALELDTANSSGALYNYIWNLIWELAKSPSQEQLREYINLYRS